MQELGRIVRLQVQRDSIKNGVKPFEVYTPVPNLVSVRSLHLTADGVEGIDESGTRLPDVHNATHPASKFRGDNGVSIGFTGHYTSMRDRFGDHMTDGIAGENITVAFNKNVSLEMIENGIVIVGAQGEIRIAPWVILTPCNPFAKFCLKLPAETKPDRTVTEALQFLMNGMRGFSAVYDADMPQANIRIDDVVYALD